MAEEDRGWAGTWEPSVVTPEMMTVLRDLAGPMLYDSRGKRITRCQVDLGTGDFTYPLPGVRIGRY